MPPNETTVPRAYPEQAPGNWTILQAREALASFQRGYLAPVSRLTRALARDDTYVLGREQFTGAVMGCPADVVPAPISYGGVGTARKLAEEAGAMLGRVLSGGVEDWLIEWGKVTNLAIGVLTWDTKARPWTPVALTRWPLEAVRVDLYERRAWAMTQGGAEIEIVPGDGTWVVWCPAGWLNFDAGLIHTFADSFVDSRLSRRDLGNRRQGASVAALQAELPAGVGPEDPEAVAYQAKVEALQTGSRAGILRPATYPAITELDLGTKDGTQLFKLSLDTNGNALIRPWLMQDGTAKNEGGSLAKAQTLEGVMMSAVARCVGSLWGEERADRSHVPGCITDQIVRPWAMYQGADPRTVPLALRRVPDLDEDARLEAEATRAGAFWVEVDTIEKRIGRSMTRTELRELAEMRGARVPASILIERVTVQVPAPPVPDSSAPVPDEESDPEDAEEEQAA
jgi:hypothetical protein